MVSDDETQQLDAAKFQEMINYCKVNLNDIKDHFQQVDQLYRRICDTIETCKKKGLKCESYKSSLADEEKLARTSLKAFKDLKVGKELADFNGILSNIRIRVFKNIQDALDLNDSERRKSLSKIEPTCKSIEKFVSDYALQLVNASAFLNRYGAKVKDATLEKNVSEVKEEMQKVRAKIGNLCDKAEQEVGCDDVILRFAKKFHKLSDELLGQVFCAIDSVRVV